MAVTVASFVESYPEFSRAPETLIDAKLAAARLQVPVSVWGDKTDLGVALTAAHLLAMSPQGEFARLVNKDGTTIYESRLAAMQRMVTSGYRVI